MKTEHPADSIEHPFVHPCERAGCREWGAFGLDVSMRQGKRGRWFCAAHRPDAKRSDEGARTERAVSERRQGVLL